MWGVLNEKETMFNLHLSFSNGYWDISYNR